MADLFTFTVKSAAEHREDMLRTQRAMYTRRGITDPNVGPESDAYVVVTSLANELAVLGANAVIKADEFMPDTAEDDDDAGTDGLSRWATILGLAKRPAVGSVGHIIFDATAPSGVAAESELTDEYSQRYKVTVGGTYTNGEAIPVEAITAGRGTNLPAGSTLKWAGTAPAYSKPTAIVSDGGLVNGADAETNEELRVRVLEYFQNPPSTGNWSHCAIIAEASTARVQKAFIYPAIGGGATVHAAVTASPTATNKSRVVAPAVMTGIVIGYFQGQLPEHVYSVMTSVVDVPADVAIALAIPDAPTATPPGSSGGWLDGIPWPSVDAATQFRCVVTSVTSSTRFVCDAQTFPSAGVTRICWLSPLTWELHTAKVIALDAGSTAGAVDVTIDTAFPNLMAGAYIWPACTNAEAYVDAALHSFALMGPGEKSSSSGVLARGFRHPRSSASYPYVLGSHMTNALTKIDEVDNASFLYRADGTTTLTGAGGSVSPQVPASLADAPNIFIPHHLGFYRQG